jgi:large subunit ribosomal protein L20
MPRVKRGVTARAKHKKILKQAKGYRGARSRVFRVAKQAVIKSLQYAYRDRRNRKRVFRRLWVARINAAARNNGMSYSRFMHGLKLAGVDLNRKMLSEIAVYHKTDFTKLVESAQLAVQNASNTEGEIAA